MGELLVTLSRQRPDGSVDAVAHSADPVVVEATVSALEQVLHGTPRRRVLRLARELQPEVPAGTP